jgi:exopolysaccharide production protein ExoQ
LALVVLLVASRSITIWYSDIGLVSADRITPLGRLVWPVLATGSLYFGFRRMAPSRPRLDRLTVVCLAALAASTMWSIDPTKTAYQAIVLGCVAVCGWFLAGAFDRDDFVRFASTTLGVVCLASAVALLVEFQLRPGAPAGFFEHKNILGLASAVATVLLLVRILNSTTTQPVWMLLAGSVVALSLSNSRTSQFAAVVAAAAVVYLAFRRRSPLVAGGVGFIMAALLSVAFVTIGGIGTIFSASGRDSDLTGRTEIWDVVVGLIGSRPILGWGYLAYWRDEGFAGGASGFEEFGLRSAHSGYLEVALGAGVAASILVLLTLLHLAVGGYRRFAASHGRPADAALVAIAVLAIVLNISESLFPSSVWTLPTLLLVALGARAASSGQPPAA